MEDAVAGAHEGGVGEGGGAFVGGLGGSNAVVVVEAGSEAVGNVEAPVGRKGVRNGAVLDGRREKGAAGFAFGGKGIEKGTAEGVGCSGGDEEYGLAGDTGFGAPVDGVAGTGKLLREALALGRVVGEGEGFGG